MKQSVLRHPMAFSQIVVRFVPWYFVEVPWKIATACMAYLRALSDIFSFFFLLRTLCSPWKSIVEAYPERGFQLGLIFQTLVLNTTSRVIGLLIRSTAFLIGLTLEAFVLAVFLAILSVWYLFPLIVVADIYYLLS